MTPEQFTYWLQGFFEISGIEELDKKQTKIIKDHLKLVFHKVTPDRTTTSPQIDFPIEYNPPFDPNHLPKIICGVSDLNKKFC
jgi:hypothetical protein